MNISKSIEDYGLPGFCAKLVQATKEGWSIDEWNPPTQYGLIYVCNVMRDDSIVDPPVPASRAEVLAKARAAKKAKAAGDDQDDASPDSAE